MYFKKIKTAKTPSKDRGQLKVLAQIMLSAFTVIACLSGFHHLQPSYNPGAAHAAAGKGIDPSLALYYEPHLRKTRSEIRSLARAIYKDASEIQGQPLSHFVQIFYHPELIRSEGSMVLWQYRNEECVMDIYFETHEHKKGSETVKYFETRSRNPHLFPEQDSVQCVHSLLRTAHRPRMVDVSSIFKL